jgi:hypothetical protein
LSIEPSFGIPNQNLRLDLATHHAATGHSALGHPPQSGARSRSRHRHDTCVLIRGANEFFAQETMMGWPTRWRGTSCVTCRAFEGRLNERLADVVTLMDEGFTRQGHSIVEQGHSIAELNHRMAELSRIMTVQFEKSNADIKLGLEALQILDERMDRRLDEQIARLQEQNRSGEDRRPAVTRGPAFERC